MDSSRRSGACGGMPGSGTSWAGALGPAPRRWPGRASSEATRISTPASPLDPRCAVGRPTAGPNNRGGAPDRAILRPMGKSDDIARYRANLQGEIDGASLYRALAGAESDPRLAEVYGRLAAVEEAHAEFWRKQLARSGARVVGGLRAGWRSRALAWLA